MYKRIGCLMVLIFIISIQSISFAEIDKQIIYKKVFSDVDRIMLYKFDLDSNKPCQLLIKGKDLRKIKKELRNLRCVQETCAERAETGGFKEGFRVLYLIKKNKKLPVLYSTVENAIIVNKSDVVPYHDEDMTKITIMQFNIDKSAMKIIEFYEQKLPTNGFFIDSWPYLNY